MNRIFLGPPLHWLIIVVLVALGWIGGKLRFHVTDFNPFVILMVVVSVIALVVVLLTTAPGQRVTREPLADNDDGEMPGTE